MKSILEEVTQRTKDYPDKLMYCFLDSKGTIKESFTYQSFDQRTKLLASSIQTNYELNEGDRVLLAYSPGLEIITAFFACVRLGLIPVPVYPPNAHGIEASVLKMNFIAKDCGAKAILTDSNTHWSLKINLKKAKSSISHLVWIISDEQPQEEIQTLPIVDNEILFLQYTSGSTNNPKGVIVTHHNILRNCKSVADHMPIGVSWLPQYHDMGLIGYYLFFAIQGGTTYGFSPTDFIKRPALWLETISKYKATASSAPNFAYDYCMLSGKISDSVLKTLDLSSLKFLMTAAESIKPSTYNAFKNKFEPFGLNPNSFFGAYGLAEFTLAVTNYGRNSYFFSSNLLQQNVAQGVDLTDDKTQTTAIMSCGKTLQGAVLKIVDPNKENLVLENGYVGEIWLQGESKCAGYWNREVLNNEIFKAKIKGNSNNNEWLRTGDLGFIYKDELYVCGRLKDLIIVRGNNYYPHDIEHIIESNPLIRKGSTAAFSIERNGKESVVVVAGLKNRTKIPEPIDLRDKINELLGLRISEIVFILGKEISKTSSGKIKRYENKQRYLNEELPVLANFDFEFHDNQSPISEFANESAADSLVESQDLNALFQYYKLSGAENSTLTNSGMDSLRLAEFSHDLEVYLRNKGFNDLSQEVDIKLLQKIVISDLYEILESFESKSTLARFKFKKAFLDIQSEFKRAESNLMALDALLRNEFRIVKPLNLQIPTENSILLTGGTGFFGPFIIQSLLEQTEEKIYVIVRSNSSQKGFERLKKAFKIIHANIPNLDETFRKRVIPICGDLSKRRLGLGEKAWQFLCSSIKTIYHNGAKVNYVHDYHNLRRANVEGTKEVIELAISQRTKTLNHISTTFIFGWSTKDTLFESDSNKSMEFLDFGYSQSKWAADQVVLKAMEKGLQARIFRPALISPSANGSGDNFDISIRLLAFMVKYGIGTTSQNQVSFTPADIAANNIVAISNIDSSINHTFHVTRDEYSSMLEITNHLSSIIGKEFRNYKLKAFVPEVVSRCTKEDSLFPLLNFLVKSADNIEAMEFKRYDNSNYQKFRKLSIHGKPDIPLEDVVMGIYKFMDSNNLI